MVQKLLNLGSHPDCADCEEDANFTPLIRAVLSRRSATPQQKDAYIKIIHSLLNAGACPFKSDSQDNVPIQYALQENYFDVDVFNILLPLMPTYILLNEGFDCPFERALESSNKDLALAMIRNFRSTDFVSPDSKEEKCRQDYTKVDINDQSLNPINIAVKAHRLDVVKLLISMGCGKFYPDATLGKAIYDGTVEITEFAIEKGADVNASDLTKENGTFLVFTYIARQALHIAFQRIAHCFKYYFVDGKLEYEWELKKMLKILNMLKMNRAAFNLKDASGKTLFDLVTLQHPSPGALLLLIHFDPSWLQDENLKKNAVRKIYEYVSHSDNFTHPIYSGTWDSGTTVQQYMNVVRLLGFLGFNMPDGHLVHQTVDFVPYPSGQFSKSAYLMRKGIRESPLFCALFIIRTTFGFR